MSIVSRRRIRGDTLVEVLFATAVFSLVAVGSLLIMNQGSATAQRALEITLVRQDIDAQAEALRYLNAKFISQPHGIDCVNPPVDEWTAISCQAIASASPYNTGSPCAIPSGAFILNARKALFIDPTGGANTPRLATTFSKVNYDANSNFSSADGIWIEAVKKTPSLSAGEAGAIYTDFHIRACWDSPGQPFPVSIGTIVRLYEPKV